MLGIDSLFHSQLFYISQHKILKNVNKMVIWVLGIENWFVPQATINFIWRGSDLVSRGSWMTQEVFFHLEGAYKFVCINIYFKFVHNFLRRTFNTQIEYVKFLLVEFYLTQIVNAYIYCIFPSFFLLDCLSRPALQPLLLFGLIPPPCSHAVAGHFSLLLCCSTGDSFLLVSLHPSLPPLLS